MRPSEALAKNRDAVLAILARYPVANPRVFGSVARGEDKEDSDLDLVIDAAGPLTYYDLAGIELDLSELLDHRVEIGVFADLRMPVRTTIAKDLRPL